MPLTVLSVAYPLARVAPATAGGAEQVLLTLDRALVAGGYRSLVVARADSEIAGTLIAVPVLQPPYDDGIVSDAHRFCAVTLEDAVRRHRPDVIHMHGIDFHAYLPRLGVPVLVTLHLPLAWYPASALKPARPNTWLHCVSKSQHATRPSGVDFLQPIENGVPLPQHAAGGTRDYALFLGRICPEKGVHLAIEAARLAGIPLVIAGEVHPYETHLRYFEEQVKPALGPNVRFAGAAGPCERDALLSRARCLVVPSLAQETSVLVAREALAAGTPVVGFRIVALIDIVEEGRTGFLVDSVDSMAVAMERASALDSEYCRRSAESRFALQPMIDSYFRVYESLVHGFARAGAA